MRFLCKTPAFPALLLLCWLSCSSLALAADPGVRDQAGLFNQETIAKADAMLKDIKAKTNKTIVIETHKGIPVDKREVFRAAGNDSAKRGKFYLDWAKSRGTALGVNGSLILVCVETEQDVAAGATPRNRVEVWTHAQAAQLFSKTEANQLMQKLGIGLRDKKPNEGLLQAVKYLQDSMGVVGGRPLGGAVEEGVRKAQNLGNRQLNNHNEGKMDTTTIIIWIVVGLVGFWIILGLVRAFTRPRYQPGAYPGQQPIGVPGQQAGPYANQPYGGQPYGQPMGQPMGYGGFPQRSGGGFFGNLMAGMFGAAAGNYIYDQWFRGGSHAPSPSSTEAGTTGGIFGGSSNEQAGYGTGGDFDQGSAPAPSTGGDYDQEITQGSDFGSSGDGGGFFGGGGGDFSGGGGGGDYGSGGDFGGGGGGDFGSAGGGDFGGGGDY